MHNIHSRSLRPSEITVSSYVQLQTASHILIKPMGSIAAGSFTNVNSRLVSPLCYQLSWLTLLVPPPPTNAARALQHAAFRCPYVLIILIVFPMMISSKRSLLRDKKSAETRPCPPPAWSLLIAHLWLAISFDKTTWCRNQWNLNVSSFSQEARQKGQLWTNWGERRDAI